MNFRFAIRRFFYTFIAGIAALLAATFPATAQVKVPPLSAYGELPGIEEIVLSPSGERIAMLVTLSGSRQLIVLGPDMKPLKRFPFDDIKVRSFDFIDEDHLLLRRSTTEDLGMGFIQDKIEFYQAFVIPVSDGKTEMVFGGRRDLVNGYFGYYGTRWIEGRPHGYFGAIELSRGSSGRTEYVFDHGRPALYSVDFTKNKARRVDYSPSEGEDRDWLIGADGSVAAKLDVSENSGEWEIRSDAGVIARGKNPAGDIYLVSIGKDGSTIIYGARDETKGSTHWYEVPINGGREPEEVFADIDLERIYVDGRTGQLTGYLREEGELVPVFYDNDKTDKVKKIRTAFASLNNRMVDWTSDFGHVIVRTTGNGDSGSFFKVDLAQLRAEAIGWERPLIGPEAVGPISRVEYTAADGLEMDGILTLPPGKEPKDLPLVMLPHGGPHSHDDVEFDWWAQAFASRGYAVFQPNFRGSTNRNGEFIRAGYGQWGRKMQTDISDGLSALAEKGVIDPKRACIVGASYGGYAALAGVTMQNGLYRCAVSVAGVSDLNMMSKIENRESGSKLTRLSLIEELGPRSGYKDISPRFHAEKADAPIMLIHGRDDTVVYFDQSKKMADALKDAGKPYEFIELKGEDHWLSLGETRQAMLEAAVAFVEKHNPAD